MVRATEIVIIAKVQNQASGQLRRLGRDVANLGKAQALANRRRMQEMQMMRQQARLTSAGGRVREQQLRQTERLRQLERDLSTNLTSRMRLQQRFNQTQDLQKRIILSRMIEATHQRDAVLEARRALYAEQNVNAQKLLSSQLKIQEAQYAHLLAQQKALAREAAIQRRAAPFLGTGRVASHVGRAATFGGLLTTAGFGAASKQFADFSTLATKASTQIADNADKGVDAVIRSGKRLETAVMRQMQIFPASQTEMADALYQLFSSMDITEAQGIKTLRNVNKLAVAMGSDLPTATNVAITTLNNFGGEGRNFNQTMDVMAAIIRLGRMELEDFDSMMNAVAPAAKGAGFSLKEMGGAMALVTRLMPSQERAATGLARLIDVFNNRDFQAGMQKAGVGILDVNGNLLDFEEIIQRIASLKPTGPGLQNFIQIMTASGKGRGVGIQSTAQARRALVLLVKEYRQLHDLQGAVNTSQGEFNKRFQAMRQSPGVQWAIFVNQLRVLAIEIGRDAIPAIVKLQAWIKGLIDKWHELSPGTRQAIIYFTALAGVIALIGGPILTVIGAISSFIGMLITLGGILGGAAGTAGIIGSLSTLLLILGRLSLIGAIVITIKVLLDMSGATDQINRLEDWLAGHGIKGFKALDELTGMRKREGRGGVGLRTGRTVDPNAPFFNPTARIPGAGTKATRDMIKEINDAKDPVAKLTKLLNQSAKETWNGIKANKVYEQIMAQVADQIDGTAAKQKQYTEDMKNWNKQRADTLRSAHEEYQRIVDTAVDNMIAKYNEFRDANASAFGSLFQGPLLTGESFQEAQQWGISPTIGIINRDLSQQITAFNKWKGDLAGIARRGAPKKLVAELTQLGPDAADKIEVLRKASPKMFNRFIALWKQKNKAIERATQQDFNQQLKLWEAHGKNMGLKIIAGLESEGGRLEVTMRRILKNAFNGDVLAEVIEDAIKEFNRDHPKPTAPKKKKVTVTKTGTQTTTVPKKPGGGGGGADSPVVTSEPHSSSYLAPGSQKIDVTIVTTEPVPVAARRAGFIIGQKAKRVAQ